VIGIEFRAQMLGVVVVHQDERLVHRQRGVGREDRRVLVRLTQLPDVKFVVGHALSHPMVFTTCIV
jgi:hypothetical protein